MQINLSPTLKDIEDLCGFISNEIKLSNTSWFMPGGLLPGGLLPYMVFMGEICDRKVLHNVAHPRKLLFDPLFAKFSQEKIKKFKNAVYIGKTSKSYYIMDMKILKRYTKEEVISELLEKCPILKYHSDDYIYYEMVYYGDLPLLFGDCEMSDTFIRLYYHTETNSFYYIARIGGKEKRKEYRCDLWSMEQVIEHFKKDIEKSKKWKEKQKIDKIKGDF